MVLNTFFDNLNCFFKEETEYVVDMPATIHKNEETGTVEEIRIYIPDYDQFMYIKRDGKVNLVDVKEENEKAK